MHYIKHAEKPRRSCVIDRAAHFAVEQLEGGQGTRPFMSRLTSTLEGGQGTRPFMSRLTSTRIRPPCRDPLA